MLDTRALLDVLPHRPPMLMIDRVLSLVPRREAHAEKDIGEDDPWVAGHFPGHPVFPGVLVIEAMAQVAGLLTMLSDVARRDGSQMVLFAGIDEARFKRQVLPGDTLLLEADLERAVRGIGRFKARASVDGQLVCEARLMAAIRDVPPPREIPSA